MFHRELGENGSDSGEVKRPQSSIAERSTPNAQLPTEEVVAVVVPTTETRSGARRGERLYIREIRAWHAIALLKAGIWSIWI
jgi:hypothetical protein